MKHIFLLILIHMSFNICAKEELNTELNGEIFRGVMQDTLAQFNYHRSQTEFLFPDYQREESFFKSFGEISYQGVISTQELGKLEYVTKNAIIYWNTRSVDSKSAGSLDMNQFIFEHHPNLFPNGEQKFVCGGLCIGAIGVGIGAIACAIWNEQCNTRCSMVSCPVGSSKVCESSCATMYCGVACNHFDPELLPIFNPPWAGGVWNTYPFADWNEFTLNGDPSGGSGPVTIGK